MICPKCGVRMNATGIAIEPKIKGRGRFSIAQIDQLIRADEVRLIRCYKCPECGHSDDGRKDDEP